VKVGILDVAGLIEETIELAPLADQLGFHRYWIAEHQPQPTPILIVGLVAGLTERIRVGTAGILFHYYAPRRTAHDFHFLERAFSGRIDAGVCGGGVAPMLQEDLEGRTIKEVFAQYPERVGKLVHHLRNTPGTEGFESRTTWIGTMNRPPEIWSLGGGARSADLAASLGLCFGYDYLYKSSKGEPAMIERYRAGFQPHWSQPAPRAVVAVAGMCADTMELAQQHAAEYKNEIFAPRVVGDAAHCAAELRAIHARFGADELVFADLIPGIDARKRQLELLASHLDLEPPVPEEASE
jgi:luciferase family oxidoreductase group 1